MQTASQQKLTWTAEVPHLLLFASARKLGSIPHPAMDTTKDYCRYINSGPINFRFRAHYCGGMDRT